MESFREYMAEYRRQLAIGAVQKAYKGLMEYMMSLRTYLNNQHPGYFVSGLYYGYMDMTYFSFYPESLKDRSLKVAIVFLHEAFRFEAWLAGYNKQVQSQYWKWLKESGWDKYHLVPATQGADSILESVLVENPDFGNLPALTERIEKGTMVFIRDIESFLSREGNSRPLMAAAGNAPGAGRTKVPHK